MVLLYFTLLGLLTCYFLFKTIVILSQTIVISFNIFSSLVHNSKEFNYDRGLLLTHSLFILLILSLSRLTHNDLNAHIFHSKFIIHNSLYFLRLINSLIHELVFIQFSALDFSTIFESLRSDYGCTMFNSIRQ